jgi:hypothetical protein
MRSSWERISMAMKGALRRYLVEGRVSRTETSGRRKRVGVVRVRSAGRA